VDKNSVIGLVLIGAILVIFSIVNSPSEEEVRERQRVIDSTEAVNKKKEAAALARQESTSQPGNINITDTIPPAVVDSINDANRKNRLGIFAPAGQGEEELYALENDNMVIHISNRGGRVVSIQLKDYLSYKKKPLYILKQERSHFNLVFPLEGSRTINTDTLFFEAQGEGFKVTGNSKKSFSIRLNAGSGKYIEYQYTLTGDSWLVDFKMNVVGIENDFASNHNRFIMQWEHDVPRQEKNLDNEALNTNIIYKYKDDEVDELSETSDEALELDGDVKWMAMKDQFFTIAMIAEEGFEMPAVASKRLMEDSLFVKNLKVEFMIPYDHGSRETFDMKLFFGPNHFGTLKDYNMDMEEIIPLGWGIFGWVNKIAVIPIFNWLDGSGMGYGLIILILTLIIKLVLFPLTYKTYISGAKMRMLKPEIEAISKKFKKEEAMKKQQATMALYKSAGVNPLGGCLPMLLQMPILYAMFRFFPASIELRQEGFLWADDLSTYDSVLELGFDIPMYGDHVSLFTLLMTASIFLTMKYGWRKRGHGQTNEDYYVHHAHYVYGLP